MLATISVSKRIAEQVEPENTLKPEAAAWVDSKTVTAGLVTGQVALPSRVVEHEWGYRAERCTIRDLRLEPPAILALGSDEAMRDGVQALEQRYQVPVSVAALDPALGQLASRSAGARADERRADMPHRPAGLGFRDGQHLRSFRAEYGRKARAGLLLHATCWSGSRPTCWRRRGGQ